MLVPERILVPAYGVEGLSLISANTFTKCVPELQGSARQTERCIMPRRTHLFLIQQSTRGCLALCCLGALIHSTSDFRRSSRKSSSAIEKGDGRYLAMDGKENVMMHVLTQVRVFGSSLKTALTRTQRSICSSVCIRSTRCHRAGGYPVSFGIDLDSHVQPSLCSASQRERHLHSARVYCDSRNWWQAHIKRGSIQDECHKNGYGCSDRT